MISAGANLGGISNGVNRKTVTSLNISGDSITAIICSSDNQGGLAILGGYSVVSRGIEQGMVSDLSEVSAAISESIEKCESLSHTKTISLIAGYDGPAIRTYNTRGSITIAEKDSEISRREIERVTESAKTIALPFDREIIHFVTRGFVLDGRDRIMDPAGMFGTRLEVDMEIVTDVISNLHNLKRAINTAGFEVQDIVLPGIAAGYSVLEDIEKDLGVIFIHISYSATHIVVYNGGQIKSIETIPYGTGNIVDAIADKFKIPAEYAADILKKESSLEVSTITTDDKIMLKIGSSQRFVPTIALYEIIEPRAKDLTHKITEVLRHMAFAKEAAAGCVVTGDLTELTGFLEMLELSLNTPVKMGLVKNAFRGSGEALKTVSHGELVCLGLARYWMQEGVRNKRRRSILKNTPIGKIIGKASEIFSDYF